MRYDPKKFPRMAGKDFGSTGHGKVDNATLEELREFDSMTQGHGQAVLRQVRTLFSMGAVGSASDGRLLEYFVSRDGNDAEAAFAELVARYGPMVLSVCRRVLRNPEDVADAFQTTFLILVRKAESIQVRDSLGRWLYGVSRRVAAKARVNAARRAVREGAEQGVEPEFPAEDQGRLELLGVLDEEVSRLPEPFRATLVLCDLRGLTHEAAARQLGCALGTVESRLSRGREKLRGRLKDRGFGSYAVAPGLYQGLVPQAVPDALSAVTIRSALARWASSPGVASLVDGVLKDMLLTKLKMLMCGIMVAGLCGIGVVAAQKPAAVEKPEVRQKGEATPTALKPTPKIKPGDRLLIEVLEALPGRPISGERIVRPDGTVSLGFYGDILVAGLDRNEIKVAVINHLRRFLRDEVLGLTVVDPNGKEFAVPAVESNRVFVDDSSNDDPGVAIETRVSQRLDRILASVEARGGKADPAMLERLNAQDQKLAEIEQKLDRLLKAIEKSDGGKR